MRVCEEKEEAGLEEELAYAEPTSRMDSIEEESWEVGDGTRISDLVPV